MATSRYHLPRLVLWTLQAALLVTKVLLMCAAMERAVALQTMKAHILRFRFPVGSLCSGACNGETCFLELELLLNNDTSADLRFLRVRFFAGSQSSGVCNDELCFSQLELLLDPADMSANLVVLFRLVAGAFVGSLDFIFPLTVISC